MGVPVFRTVQHIVRHIVMFRIHQNCITAGPQKCFYGISPAFIFQTDNILTGKLRPGSDFSSVKFPVDLIPQSHIIRNLPVGIPVLPALFQNPVLSVQLPADIGQLQLHAGYFFHQVLKNLICPLPESPHRSLLLRSRVFLSAKRCQYPPVFQFFLFFKKTGHHLTDHPLEMLQFLTCFRQLFLFFFQNIQPPLLIGNHPGTVQLIQTDSCLYQLLIRPFFLFLQNLQFSCQILLFFCGFLLLPGLALDFLPDIPHLFVHNTDIIRKQPVPRIFPGVILPQDRVQFPDFQLNGIKIFIEPLDIFLCFNQFAEIHIALFQHTLPDKLIDAGVRVIGHDSSQLPEIGGNLSDIQLQSGDLHEFGKALLPVHKSQPVLFLKIGCTVGHCHAVFLPGMLHLFQKGPVHHIPIRLTIIGCIGLDDSSQQK